jgi:hypothetical protein
MAQWSIIHVEARTAVSPAIFIQSSHLPFLVNRKIFKSSSMDDREFVQEAMIRPVFRAVCHPEDSECSRNNDGSRIKEFGQAILIWPRIDTVGTLGQ